VRKIRDLSLLFEHVTFRFALAPVLASTGIRVRLRASEG